MPDVIAFCGFLGAWLLVIGPPPVSAWWWLAPPVYLVLRRRRDRAYHQRIAAVMRPEELDAFAHLRDVANAWIFVAAGASLIAAKETWELREHYHWAQWTFWALMAVMLLVCAFRVSSRAQRLRPRRS